MLVTLHKDIRNKTNSVVYTQESDADREQLEKMYADSQKPPEPAPAPVDPKSLGFFKRAKE